MTPPPELLPGSYKVIRTSRLVNGDTIEVHLYKDRGDRKLNFAVEAEQIRIHLHGQSIRQMADEFRVLLNAPVQAFLVVLCKQALASVRMIPAEEFSDKSAQAVFVLIVAAGIKQMGHKQRVPYSLVLQL